jgi:hypothetical protein
MICRRWPLLPAHALSANPGGYGHCSTHALWGQAIHRGSRSVDARPRPEHTRPIPPSRMHQRSVPDPVLPRGSPPAGAGQRAAALLPAAAAGGRGAARGTRRFPRPRRQVGPVVLSTACVRALLPTCTRAHAVAWSRHACMRTHGACTRMPQCIMHACTCMAHALTCMNLSDAPCRLHGGPLHVHARGARDYPVPSPPNGSPGTVCPSP